MEMKEYFTLKEYFSRREKIWIDMTELTGRKEKRLLTSSVYKMMIQPSHKLDIIEHDFGHRS